MNINRLTICAMVRSPNITKKQKHNLTQENNHIKQYPTDKRKQLSQTTHKTNQKELQVQSAGTTVLSSFEVSSGSISS